MDILRTAFLLVVGSSLTSAAQVRFLPGTICSGNSGNCKDYATKVVAAGSKSVLIRPLFLISPLSSGTEFEIRSNSLRGGMIWYTTAPVLPVKNGFRHPVKARGDFSGRDTIRVTPGDTVTLSNFRFGTCFYCVSIAARSAATGHLGNGERVGMLFGSDTTRLDTLWVTANQWFNGGILPRPPEDIDAPNALPRDALGRRTTSSVPGFSLTLDGAPLAPDR